MTSAAAWQVLVVAAEMKFMGLRFSELSFSVL